MPYISLAKNVFERPKDPRKQPVAKYDFIKTLRDGPKNRKKIYALRDKHLAKGETVFIMVTVDNPVEKIRSGGNRRQRRFAAKLMRGFMKKMLRRGKEAEVDEETKKKVDDAVDEEFDRRDSGLVVPKGRKRQRSDGRQRSRQRK